MPIEVHYPTPEILNRGLLLPLLAMADLVRVSERRKESVPSHWQEPQAWVKAVSLHLYSLL